MPTDNGLGRQNLKDRYHGSNDPVAAKLLKKYLKTPEDTSITTLFITGIDEDINELDVRYGIANEELILKLLERSSTSICSTRQRALL